MKPQCTKNNSIIDSARSLTTFGSGPDFCSVIFNGTKIDTIGISRQQPEHDESGKKEPETKSQAC